MVELIKGFVANLKLSSNVNAYLTKELNSWHFLLNKRPPQLQKIEITLSIESV